MLIFTWTVAHEDAPPPRVDLAAVFDEHGAFLLRCARRWVPTDADAEDVVQDVFLIANRKRDELDPDGNLRAWLYRTANNVVLHQRRSFLRRKNLGERWRDDPSAAAHAERAEDNLERQRAADLVRHVTARLPVAQRDVFVLFELEELSGADVAAMLGISENAVWTRLHRARQSFRRLLEEQRAAQQGGDDEPARRAVA